MTKGVADDSAENIGSRIRYTAEIVGAFVRNNSVPAADLPNLIRTVHATLGGLGGSGAGETRSDSKPAVPVRKSITPDFLVCLEDGKKLKMLKRYLRSRFNGMTPDQYRAKWGLPTDYPMVAPNYAALRSNFAKRIGLGRSKTPPKHRRRSA
jgi:predicted transcriptional regulator